MEDLTGKVFGYLTVNGFSHREDTGYFWRVTCSCGKELVVRRNSLTQGRSSCGCKKVKRTNKIEDLTGQVFGEQTVIGFSHTDKYRSSFWMVKCVCGSERPVVGSALKSGRIKACGCKRNRDLVGKRFGRLMVLGRAGYTGGYHVKWDCLCDCGKHNSPTTNALLSGSSTSCGCYHYETFAESRRTHGKSGTRMAKIFDSMRYRCYNPKHNQYKDYGGRGIYICDEWLNDRSSFYNWCESSGYADKLTIDRIDNEGPYSPENCRWATRKEQGRNSRHNHIITFNNKSMVLEEWAEKLGINSGVIGCRIKAGKTTEQALSPYNLKTGEKLHRTDKI